MTDGRERVRSVLSKIRIGVFPSFPIDRDLGLEAPRNGSWGFRDAGPTPWSLGGSGNSSICPPVLFVGYLLFGRAFLLGGLVLVLHSLYLVQQNIANSRSRRQTQGFAEPEAFAFATRRGEQSPKAQRTSAASNQIPGE